MHWWESRWPSGVIIRKADGADRVTDHAVRALDQRRHPVPAVGALGEILNTPAIGTLVDETVAVAVLRKGKGHRPATLIVREDFPCQGMHDQKPLPLHQRVGGEMKMSQNSVAGALVVMMPGLPPDEASVEGPAIEGLEATR